MKKPVTAKNLVLLYLFDKVFRHRITTDLMMASLSKCVNNTLLKLQESDSRKVFNVILQALLVHMQLGTNETQLRWVECIVDLFFMHTAMSGSAKKIDSLDD